jgi:hypothetical protein
MSAKLKKKETGFIDLSPAMGKEKSWRPFSSSSQHSKNKPKVKS